jgi:putative FmdB family regulatory protein
MYGASSSRPSGTLAVCPAHRLTVVGFRAASRPASPASTRPRSYSAFVIAPRALLPSGAVPIYEYVCMECESHFEELVRGEEQVACPDCTATSVSRQFSSFAVHGVKKVAAGGGGGGGCCGGSCGCGH